MKAKLIQNSPKNRTEKTLIQADLLVGAERNLSGKTVVALKLYPADGTMRVILPWRYSLDVDVDTARELVRLLQDRIAWIESQSHQTCSIALSVLAPIANEALP